MKCIKNCWEACDKLHKSLYLKFWRLTRTEIASRYSSNRRKVGRGGFHTTQGLQETDTLPLNGRSREWCDKPWWEARNCASWSRGLGPTTEPRLPGQPRQLSGDKKTSARWRQRSEIARQLRVKWDKLTQNTGSKNHHRELFLGSGKAKWLMPTLSICSQRRPWWCKTQLLRTLAKPQWENLLVSYGISTCSFKI